MHLNSFSAQRPPPTHKSSRTRWDIQALLHVLGLPQCPPLKWTPRGCRFCSVTLSWLHVLTLLSLWRRVRGRSRRPWFPLRASASPTAGCWLCSSPEKRQTARAHGVGGVRAGVREGREQCDVWDAPSSVQPLRPTGF